MTSGLVIHIEHGGLTRTEVVMRERIRIGHDATCDVCLPSDGALSTPIEIELARTSDGYEVERAAPESVLFINDTPLREGAIIRDGDELHPMDGAIRLRFYRAGVSGALVAMTPDQVAVHEPEEFGGGARVAPFIEHAAIEAAATARRDDAKVFLREFTRELVREISPVTKIVTMLLIAALVGGLIYFPYAYYHEMRRARGENEAMRAELAAVRDAMGVTTNRITQIDENNAAIVNILTNAPQLAAKYSSGVCLIAGTYQWYETGTNRPLRHPQGGVEEDGIPQPTEAEGEGATLTPDGAGAIAQYDFVGTGFHVGGGYVVTNRHVAARPWEADPRSSYLTGTVPARARVVRLVAFFPNRRQPLPMRLRATNPTEDLAVCTVNIGNAKNVPALPLDTEMDANPIGNEVVMMGYPSGPDRLLALLPEQQSRTAQTRYGNSLENLIGYLANQNLIRPLTTRGTITDLLARRIVYDARTAEGGSGAPLFGQSGRVIGVNFAVLPSNSASNLAIPVSFARELLTRSGWTPPAPAKLEIEADAATTANDNSAIPLRTPSPSVSGAR